MRSDIEDRTHLKLLTNFRMSDRSLPQTLEQNCDRITNQSVLRRSIGKFCLIS
ncbi:MAG: hypothetical protein HC930_09640 [Hydrococcus sp. SU_1_0]|nr:hypothetical protein [Hydrococcus sp. SU_1_0]NJO95067.1 hypothetical protein [Pleurocapsa sp. CRU_1_2]